MKRIAFSTAVVTVAVLSLALLGRMPAQSAEPGFSGTFGTFGFGFDDSRIARGFQISPVKLNLKGRNPGLVGLGSYLVNAVGSCNDCHSCPSYASNPYQGGSGRINSVGYLAGGVPFGPFTSRNLTPEPDEGNLPAGLTFDQFALTMRTGIDLDHVHPQISPLLQVMPWPVLRLMDARDLRAIYEYLSAIPHADTPPPGTCSTAGE